MIAVRKSEDRGYFDHGWLKTHHTFSFDQYHDPKHVHFRSLRVINEDFVAPGVGFPTHPHRDMEIITYVLEGALAHKDSLGTGAVIRPGEGQRMSAGTGIQHSEFNASKDEPVHLLQIWIFPEQKGLQPSYEQKAFPDEEKQGKLRLIAAREPRNDAVKIHQDVELYVSKLAPGQEVAHTLRDGRHAWVQVARGEVTVNGTKLKQGDGAGVSDERELKISGTADAEVLLFDLA